ncbi:hypothetical protein RN22_09730 [Grimontia sp. AD028]|uniref:putative phage abortive infection protein n=1 Tax=Grimontia sp. AD028 TaxID=1581149 RepID=UPI00061AFB7A|nr:putative phage abortive infection protein [Grimontia sp. AD028]KKD60682.1 hypothetical protein RN22_09730 [Grimontia sp. AD028]
MNNSNYNHQFLNAKTIIRICIGIFFLVIPLLILFLWQTPKFITSVPIDNSKFGTFGDFFGGVFGSLWSLAGVFLFYVALKEQRGDFQTNSQALTKQVDALNLQAEEFRLQREELSQTRNVFVEQSKILKKQSLESTYFSLLELYSRINSELNKKCENGYFFEKIKETLNDGRIPTYLKSHQEHFEHFLDKYQELVCQQNESFAHYFKILYRIIKTVDNSEISENEKFLYVKILRSQLSESELLAIYYNSYCDESKELYKLILKYNLLKHLTKESKCEIRYLFSDASTRSALSKLSSNLESQLFNFMDDVKTKIRQDDFQDKVAISYEYDKLTVRLESEDDVEISVTLKCEESHHRYFKHGNFSKYLEFLLSDILITSQYKEHADFEIENSEMSDNTIKIKIKSKRALTIASDAI